MAEKILIIGGVALGPKAAARCARLAPEADITMVDENVFISYGGCGMPYYVSGEVQNIDALRSTSADVVRDPEFFKKLKGITVLNQTRAQKIDRENKKVLVENLANGEKRELPYDKLLIATGARARVPQICGVTLKGVLALTRLEAADEIRKACETGKISSAVIVGGGFIGLEAAVALADMWGVKVTVVEMMDQILTGVLSPELAKMAENDLRKHDVDVFVSESVQKLEGDGDQVCAVVTDKRKIDCQLVLFATGFQPNGALAAAAGLETTEFGAVIVDEHMRTSDPAIYAGGDCCAIKNLITGKIGYLPLGSLANRQGRVIGTNLAGGDATFPGFVGTWVVKLFDMTFCGAGLTPSQGVFAGFEAVGISVEQLTHAHFYPEKDMMTLEIVVDKATRRVLGLQGACVDGAAVKARIDAVAGVLEYARPTLADISNMEVSYAPPLASAMDIVNTVANVAENVLDGRMPALTPVEFMTLWHNRADNDVFFIDLRPYKASKPIENDYPDWHAIPLEELRERFAEIPKDRPLALICNSGARAYEGLVALMQNGYGDVRNSMGGMQAVTKMGMKPQE